MDVNLKTLQLPAIILFIFFAQTTTCGGIPLEYWFPAPPQNDPPPTAPPAPPVTGLDCTNFRLASPRGGLANGAVTFFWDRLEGATSYRINIYDEYGGHLAGFDAGADQTNLTADVSWNTIGGQFGFEVELIATDERGDTCRDAVSMQREAPPAPAQPLPTATLTCQQDPFANYC